MNKRLQMLEKLTSSDSADSFAFYGLAMEYRKEGRVDDALATFGQRPNQITFGHDALDTATVRGHHERTDAVQSQHIGRFGDGRVGCDRGHRGTLRRQNP